MDKRLNVLVLIKPFHKSYPKHKAKIGMITALEEYADVTYWDQDGDIRDIIDELKIEPDFIFHYDVAWNHAFAPAISGLDQVDIPKGCMVIDVHWTKQARVDYFINNNIDLIFSISKHPFLSVWPEFEDRLHWWPWAVDPEVFKDWNLEREYDYLLMGLVYADHMPGRGVRNNTRKGEYPFREEVLKAMLDTPGFQFHQHPGHLNKNPYFANERYAQELSRAKIFFTCGSSIAGGLPVLKFFEAPACRTLLLAEPNQDIDELGFQDGVNYVACDRTNFKEKAQYYLEHEEERNAIAEAGYRFIHQHHTNQVRAKQFVDAVQALIAKR